VSFCFAFFLLPLRLHICLLKFEFSVHPDALAVQTLVTMSKQDPADQVKFLVSCIGHTSNGRVSSALFVFLHSS
jgi:hypothetical protein